MFRFISLRWTSDWSSRIILDSSERSRRPIAQTNHWTRSRGGELLRFFVFQSCPHMRADQYCPSHLFLAPAVPPVLSSSHSTPQQTIDHIRHYTTSIPSLPPSLQISARASYLSALRAVFLFNAGVATVTLVSTLFLKEYPLAGSFAEEQEQEEERRRRSGESTPVERRGREE